jgi:hypothetical protein
VPVHLQLKTYNEAMRSASQAAVLRRAIAEAEERKASGDASTADGDAVVNAVLALALRQGELRGEGARSIRKVVTLAGAQKELRELEEEARARGGHDVHAVIRAAIVETFVALRRCAASVVRCLNILNNKKGVWVCGVASSAAERFCWACG